MGHLSVYSVGIPLLALGAYLYMSKIDDIRNNFFFVRVPIVLEDTRDVITTTSASSDCTSAFTYLF